jgi:hypothetical protein
MQVSHLYTDAKPDDGRAADDALSFLRKAEPSTDDGKQYGRKRPP